MDKKILIIIITYNIGDAISHCLDSLVKQTDQNYELLLIDNNSSNSTLDSIHNYLNHNRSLMRKTELIENKVNLGFSGAVNIGLNKALKQKEFYWVLLLNQDIYFENNLLEKGIGLMQKNPTAGAVLPKILYPDGRVWWVGTKILSDTELIFSSSYGITKHFNKGEKINFNNNEVRQMDALTGCAVFLRLSAVKDVGLFDERYFMYAEDIDYSLRLKIKGYKVLLFTSSTVYHEIEDNQMNLKIVRLRLKKYKIYLTSVGLYLLKYKPWIFPIWLIKLPFVLIINYLKRKE